MSTLGSGAAERLRSINARHPWSHNDYFHSWILANFPQKRFSAVDVGCGRGELVRALAPHFEQVTGTDLDPEMRRLAERSSPSNVTITDHQLDSWSDESVDLVTMIAVLHHLDIEDSLRHVRRILAPTGRLLVVGLAPPKSPQDLLWDAVSIVTNPLIGYVHHPWPSPTGPEPPPFPVKDPELGFDHIETIAHRTLPGSNMRHRIGFRHTIEWTKPLSDN